MLEVLGAVPGLEIQSTAADCCGMAGSYGYKTVTYDVSRELGTRLVSELDRIDRDAGGVDEVLACGTSCRTQIADFGKARPRHPIERLAEAIA